MRFTPLSISALFLTLVGLFPCCGAPQPVASAPTPSASAPAVPSAPASTASAVASASASAPEPAQPTIVLHLVLQSRVLISPRGYAFPGGGLLVGNALIAIVTGEQVRQDPNWLVGVPEYVNWDSQASATVPLLASAPAEPTIPVGTTFMVSAGNRHGPGTVLQRTTKGWVKQATRTLDPRIRALKLSEYSQSSLLFPNGHLLATGTAPDNTWKFYSFAPGATTPTTSVVPGEPSDPRIVAANPDRPYLFSYLGAIYEIVDGAWKPIEKVKSVSSAAVTADGALWIVDFSTPRLLRRTTAGALEPVSVTSGFRPEEVTAADNRVFVSGGSSGSSAVFSNVPVTTPLTVSEEQIAHSPFEGFSGLNVESQSVPNVSASPPGPGTRACTSLVVYLGASLTPQLKQALRKHDETAKLPLIQVSGTAPGRAVLIGGTANMDVLPSNRPVPAIAVVPKDFEQGLALVQTLAGDLPKESAPKLLCAVPRGAKQLGPVGP